jgi:hypothetical protein
MPSSSSPAVLQTLAVIFPVSEYSLSLFRKHFSTVHYYPEGDIPADLAAESHIWFCRWVGLPEHLEFKDLRSTRVVQLTSGEY